MQTILSPLFQNKSLSTKLMLKAGLVVLGTLFLALSAQIKIPFWPVPLTMNHTAAMFLGLVYGPSLGAVTVIAYFAEALLGLPVLAGGVGPAYIFGPAAGFFTGYIAATFMMGLFARKNLSYLQTFLGFAFGMLVIYTLGVLNLLRFMDVMKALSVGVIPFIVPNLAACLFFAQAYHMIKKKA